MPSKFAFEKPTQCAQPVDAVLLVLGDAPQMRAGRSERVAHPNNRRVVAAAGSAHCRRLQRLLLSPAQVVQLHATLALLAGDADEASGGQRLPVDGQEHRAPDDRLIEQKEVPAQKK